MIEFNHNLRGIEHKYGDPNWVGRMVGSIFLTDNIHHLNLSINTLASVVLQRTTASIQSLQKYGTGAVW